MENIYKIECLTTGLIYVGSTTKEFLSQRLAKHKHHYNEYINGKHRFTTSFIILENNNYHIELLEEVNCETKDQLHIREGHYIRTLECVNRCVMGRTPEQYRDENKEKIKQYYQNKKEEVKQYYQDNKEHKKKYYQDNKETILEQKKKYIILHKEERKQKRAVKFQCPCGIEIQYGAKARHEHSKKHQAYLLTL